MAFPILAVASFVGGLLGSSAQRRAEERARKQQLAWLQEYYGPSMRVRRQLEGKLGKESPLLAAQHQFALQDINQEEAAQLTGSEGYWKRMGNEGRARGEKWRLRGEATRARAEEALSYGQNQQQYKDYVMRMILGSGGPEGQAIGEVIRDRGAIQSSFLGQVGTGLGTFLGALDQGKKSTASALPAKKATAASATRSPVRSQTAIEDTPLLDRPTLDKELLPDTDRKPWRQRTAWRGPSSGRRWPRYLPARM